MSVEFLRDLLQNQEIVLTQLLFILGQQAFLEIQRLRNPAQHKDLPSKGMAVVAAFMPPDPSEKPFVCVVGGHFGKSQTF